VGVLSPLKRPAISASRVSDDAEVAVRRIISALVLQQARQGPLEQFLPVSDLSVSGLPVNCPFSAASKALL
jgi:hypothetical protein